MSIPFLRSLARARTVLRTEKAHSEQQKRLGLHEIALSLAPVPGIQLRLGPAHVRDAAEFQGSIYAATSAGLQQYSADGQMLHQFTTAEGFPTLDVTSLAADKDSLWIGTADAGWIRFSDRSWKQYLPEDKTLRSVRSLLITRQGSIFIGTAAGVIQYNGKEYRRFHPEQLSKTGITRLAGDSLNLWIGTFDSGMYVFKNGVLSHFTTEDGLPDSLITDIHMVREKAFVSTPSGVVLADGRQFQRVLNNTFVQSLEMRGKSLWAASRDQGILRIDAGNALKRPSRYVPAAPQLKDSGATLRKIGYTVMAFAPGKSWYLGANDRWQAWGRATSTLEDSNISSLLRAADGKLWVGYFDHGLDVLTADFERIAHYEDDVFFCINYLAQDSAGRIYVSTANGLAVMEPGGSRRIYHEADGLLSDRVMQAVPLDPDGRRVAIATAQGFTLMQNGAMKSLYAFHGLVNNHVYAIAGRKDQIYVGTLGGISRISDMRVISSWTQMDSGLRRNWVNALLALDDRLLVGTYGSGIQSRSETGDWTAFEALPKDFEVNPNAFFYDGRFVFCGTLDRGVFVYDTRRNRWKQILNELPAPNATAFARSGNNLYVATERGLLQISYDKINTLPDLR